MSGRDKDFIGGRLAKTLDAMAFCVALGGLVRGVAGLFSGN